MQNYIVIEIQVGTNGNAATIVTAYEDYGQAQQKYHTILAAAAVSALPVHSATVLSPYGVELEHKGYNRLQNQETA